jgi:hypothetical protein
MARSGLSDDRARRLDADLRGVGFWPRLLSVGLLVALVACAVGAGYAWWWGALIAAGVLVVVLAFRIRATVTENEFVVRSYFRTHRFRLDDDAIVFVDVPYQGWWSGYAPALLFGWGPAQIDVEGLYRAGRSLPATMCGQGQAGRIADALNDRLANG